jgi:hypothetical protein
MARLKVLPKGELVFATEELRQKYYRVMAEMRADLAEGISKREIGRRAAEYSMEEDKRRRAYEELAKIRA